MTNVVPIGNTSRGFTRMDNELYEALIGADLSGRELRVALAIHRLTVGFNKESVKVAALYLAKMLYGERKAEAERANVSRAINSLIRQRVLFRSGGSRDPLTILPVSEWKIDDKSTVLKSTHCVEKTPSSVLKITHIKDSKENNSLTGVIAAAAATPAEPVAATQEQEPAAATAQPAQKAQEDRIPYAEIANLYNAICGQVLPKCKSLTDKRKAAIRGCWNLKFGGKYVFRDLDFWEGYFNDAAEHPFLTGQRTNWRADFDFLTRASSAVSVLEGKYDR